MGCVPNFDSGGCVTFMLAKKILKGFGILMVALLILPVLIIDGYAFLKPAGHYDTALVQKILLDTGKRLQDAQNESRSSENGWSKVSGFFDQSNLVFTKGLRLYAKLYFAHEPYKTFAPQIAQFVKAFNPYYTRMKDAVDAREFAFPIEMDGPWISLYGKTPDIFPMWAFSHALALKARYHLENKEWDKAIDCYLLSDRLGERLEPNSTLVIGMIALSMRTIPLEPYLSDLGKMKAPAAFYEHSIKKLDAIPDSQDALLSMMDNEFYFGEGLYDQMMSGKLSPTQFFQGVQAYYADKPLAAPNPPGLLTRVALFLLQPYIARERALFERWYLVVRAGYGLPALEQEHDMTKISEDFTREWKDKFSIFNPHLMPGISLVYEKQNYLESLEGALKVSSALYAYQATHHQLPDSLNRLVPGLLSVLPRDPFNPKGNYAYLKTGSDFTLYSYGPDGVDHGGRSKRLTTDLMYTPVAKEDILFHRAQ